jgi:hypothetical protein
MSRSRPLDCCVPTSRVASSMLSAGVPHVLPVPASVDGCLRLSYPLHFVTLREQDARAENGASYFQVCPMESELVF